MYVLLVLGAWSLWRTVQLRPAESERYAFAGVWRAAESSAVGNPQSDIE
jgi:hypothetical protein